jgi:hypothetical protein
MYPTTSVGVGRVGDGAAGKDEVLSASIDDVGDGYGGCRGVGLTFGV